MKRSTVNFIIDSIAFISLIFLLTTGVISRYILPKGSGSYLTVWGLDRHGWGDIHFYIALLFLFLIVVHIILHWDWIVVMVRGKDQEKFYQRLMWAIIAFFVILVMAVAPLISPVSKNESGVNYGRVRHRSE